jgi:hypothetical protein
MRRNLIFRVFVSSTFSDLIVERIKPILDSMRAAANKFR